MSTLRQIEANRRNSQKSTGPTSVAGKAASSMNALNTGIHAKSLIIQGEKRADLELLIAEHYRDHRPTTAKARFLVDEVIRGEWTLRRLAKAESQMWEHQNERKFSDLENYPLGYSASAKYPAFSKVQCRIDSARRALYRALQALDQLRSEPAPAPDEPAPLDSPSPAPPSPQIGFVPLPPIEPQSQSPAAPQAFSFARPGPRLCHPGL